MEKRNDFNFWCPDCKEPRFVTVEFVHLGRGIIWLLFILPVSVLVLLAQIVFFVPTLGQSYRLVDGLFRIVKENWHFSQYHAGSLETM